MGQPECEFEVMLFSNQQYHESFSIWLVNHVLFGQISGDTPRNILRYIVLEALLCAILN